jgi:dCMP deaminase
MTNKDNIYMQVARLHSTLSHSKRLKVGACLVTTNGLILGGVNGLPKPLGNVLEDNLGRTKIETIHAEENCLLKACKEGVSTKNSVVYVTHSPCRHCASMLVEAGVSKVVYESLYRDDSGLILLENSGIIVETFYE